MSFQMWELDLKARIQLQCKSFPQKNQTRLQEQKNGHEIPFLTAAWKQRMMENTG